MVLRVIEFCVEHNVLTSFFLMLVMIVACYFAGNYNFGEDNLFMGGF